MGYLVEEEITLRCYDLRFLLIDQFFSGSIDLRVFRSIYPEAIMPETISQHFIDTALPTAFNQRIESLIGKI